MTIKFHTREEAQQFCLELDRIDLLPEVTSAAFSPSEDLTELFIKRRQGIVPSLKDFRRSQTSKENWRRNRHRYLRGISRFHRSTDGKKFHRQMGRFLASRDFYSSGLSRQRESYDIREITEFLVALSSARTHLLIEADYYRTVDQQVDYEILVEDFLPLISSVESRVLKGEPLLDEEFETVALLCSPKTMLTLLSEQHSVPEETIQLLARPLEANPDVPLFEVYKSVTSK